MSGKKRPRSESEGDVDDSLIKKDIKSKKDLAKQLLEGREVEKDEAKAVSLLEECVSHGDANAMLTLAKCCALGRGIKRDAKRAYDLIEESARQGNFEATRLWWLALGCFGAVQIDLDGLRLGKYMQKEFDFTLILMVCFVPDLLDGYSRTDCTDQEGYDPYYLTGSYLLLNMFPLQSIKIGRLSCVRHCRMDEHITSMIV